MLSKTKKIAKRCFAVLLLIVFSVSVYFWFFKWWIRPAEIDTDVVERIAAVLNTEHYPDYASLESAFSGLDMELCDKTDVTLRRRTLSFSNGTVSYNVHFSDISDMEETHFSYGSDMFCTVGLKDSTETGTLYGVTVKSLTEYLKSEYGVFKPLYNRQVLHVKTEEYELICSPLTVSRDEFRSPLTRAAEIFFVLETENYCLTFYEHSGTRDRVILYNEVLSELCTILEAGAR